MWSKWAREHDDRCDVVIRPSELAGPTEAPPTSVAVPCRRWSRRAVLHQISVGAGDLDLMDALGGVTLERHVTVAAG